MKRIILLCSLLAACIIQAAAQKTDTLSLICREWKIQSIKGDAYEKLDADEKIPIDSAVLVFNKNMTYTSYLGTKVAEQGSWKYIPSKKRVEAISNDQTTTTLLDIISINENELNARSFISGEEGELHIVFKAVKTKQ